MGFYETRLKFHNAIFFIWNKKILTECSVAFEKMIVVSLKLEFRKSKRGFITGRGESVYQKS